MNDFDICVIGAGVVGLACARALALSGRSVIILEKESHFGTHTSARNSEVIHAGIYYPAGSLKAQTCVAGKERLYTYCAAKGIPHKRCGKYIVATSEAEIVTLQEIKAKAEANGVMDLRFETPHWPEIKCAAALFSPSSGIIDSHALMQALLGDAEEAGAVLVCNSPVIKITDNFVVYTPDAEIRVGAVVNAAGLWASEVARMIDAPLSVPETAYARGHYFKLQGVEAHFDSLIYPVPVAGGLGTHITFDLAGQIRFGPDVQWIDGVDYDFPDGREASFYESIRRYWPSLPDNCLVKDYTGIRPKVAGGDFIIDYSVEGLINLYGVESPGLTACLALGDMVLQNLSFPRKRESPLI